MQFDHQHHELTHDQVKEFLDELFDSPYLDTENGHFYVGYGSTVLEIAVEPYGPEETMIEVTAYCVQGASLTEELALGLLELNHEIHVGGFSLVGTDIFFSHAIFGRSLDRKNLLGTIAAVANTSDEWDDRIVAKYGGQTALDRIRDTGSRRQRRERRPGGGNDATATAN